MDTKNMLWDLRQGKISEISWYVNCYENAPDPWADYSYNIKCSNRADYYDFTEERLPTDVGSPTSKTITLDLAGAITELNNAPKNKITLK